MNIYIYGNSSFNKEIHELLNHANAKFRLGDHGSIIELNSLAALKKAIDINPEDIFLIDDEKIIKKNSLNSKFKFLTPKDGIELEYLLDHGIGDMAVDSMDELAKHIVHKLDALNSNEDDNIQESIQNIVNEAYDEEYEKLDSELSSLLVNNKEIEKSEESFDLDNEAFDDTAFEEAMSSVDEDDDMEDFFNQMPKMEDDVLATSSKDYFDEYINEKNDKPEYIEIKEEPLADLDLALAPTLDSLDQRLLEQLEENSVTEADLMDLDQLMSVKLSAQNVKKKVTTPVIEEKKSEKQPIEEKTDIIKEVKEEVSKPTLTKDEGEKMADNFTELDSLNESDVLSALAGLGDEVVATTPTPTVNSGESKSEAVTIEATNLDEISNLLKQLLNNKTLEISIRIKD